MILNDKSVILRMMSYSESTKELDTIVNTLNDCIKMALSPFVDNMVRSRQQVDTVETIMKQLPDYQRILSENADLKLENARLRIKIAEQKAMFPTPIKLTVSEKSASDELPDNFVEEIYAEAHLSTTNSTHSLLDNLNKNEMSMEQEEEHEDDEQEEEHEEEEVEVDEEEQEVEEDVEEEEVDEVEEEVDEEEEEVDEEEEEDEDEEEVEEEVNEEEEEEEEEEVKGEEEEEVEVEVDEEEEEEEEEEVDEEEEEEEEDEEEEEEEEVEVEVDEEEVDEEEVEEKKSETELSKQDDNEDEEQDEEVYIVELDGTDYYTNDDENGDIYKIMEDEDIGNKVGEFQNGEAVIY